MWDILCLVAEKMTFQYMEKISESERNYAASYLSNYSCLLQLKSMVKHMHHYYNFYLFIYLFICMMEDQYTKKEIMVLYWKIKLLENKLIFIRLTAATHMHMHEN